MKHYILSTLIVFTPMLLHAQQDIKSVLASIERNNTTLQSSRETMEAEKIANRTGIYLANPEVEFGYLWGDPASLGNRTDFSVTQSFDIATLSGLRSNAANEENTLVEWQYKTDRMNILLEAKQYCIELVYYNALKEELEIRRQHATMIANGYEERLRQGDASQLDYNKAKLNLSTAQGELTRVEVEQSALLEQLKRLNGGETITLENVEFEPLLLPHRFDDWYQLAEERNPALAYIRQQVEVQKKQVSLKKAMNLPTFTAGYLSENVVGEKFQGFTVGVSIPLWENKNQVRHARASVKAAESRLEEGQQQFYNNLQLLYNRTVGLKNVAEDYRKAIEMANSTELLKKALDAGQISLLEYVLEIGLYYDIVERALEAEKDYHQAYTELSAIEL